MKLASTSITAMNCRRKKKEKCSNSHTSLTSLDIMDLVNVCMQCTYFSYKNNVYQHTEGTPMGSPLSPVFSEFFLQFLESQVVQENNKIFYYKRYVDDIFAVIKEGTQEIILNELNNFDPNIQFTFELENNKTLPFLDLCVMRNDDGSISRKVYRNFVNILP
jgi:hypothetical protein